MYNTVGVEAIQSPCLKLGYNDIRLMGLGHHPLIFMQMTMKYNPQLGELSALDIDDVLSNAEYLCDCLGSIGIVCGDLHPLSYEIFKLTKGMTRVSDDILAEIVSLALRRGLIRWLPKNNMQVSSQHRSFQTLPFLACADIANGVYPIDTPKRVIESHNALHLAWKQRPCHGIVSTYLIKDFISLHTTITQKMQQYSIEHTDIDFLDMITYAGGGGGAKGASPENHDYDILPEDTDIDEQNEVTNFIDILLTDHIINLKNYISARDEDNVDLTKQFDSALDDNLEDLAELISKKIVVVDTDESNAKKDRVKSEFRNIWRSYLVAVKAMVEGGDALRESQAKSGLRNMLLAKEAIVKFFVSLFARVAQKSILDEQFALWMNHIQGYVDFRDNEDFTTSRAHLEDLLKAKTEIAGILGRWTIMTRRLENKDTDKPKELDLDEVEESSQFPRVGRRAGGTQPGATSPHKPLPKGYWNEQAPTNPPAPMDPATRDVNRARKAVVGGKSLQDAGASSATTSPAAPVPASDAGPTSATAYNPHRVADIRETPTGHRPYSHDCKPDYRTGKCYKIHRGE